MKTAKFTQISLFQNFTKHTRAVSDEVAAYLAKNSSVIKVVLVVKDYIEKCKDYFQELLEDEPSVIEKFLERMNKSNNLQNGTGNVEKRTKYLLKNEARGNRTHTNSKFNK